MKKDIMNAEMNTKIKELLTTIIESNVSNETYTWLLDKAAQTTGNNNYQLNPAFTAIPRKTGKKEVVIKESDIKKIIDLSPGFSIQHWTIDRLCRVWLLLQLEINDKENYISKIEDLFLQAEMNEQIALYSSLHFLAYPESWKMRCATGIRSNIGTVLDAIMYQNPYPAKYLDEPAWNQLIMKAFFTDKNVSKITGLDERANQNLANMLFDYVEERWAARRTADPQIWRLTGKYMDEPHLYMLERLFKSENKTDQQAAAFACTDSSFEKSKLLLDQFPEYKNAVNNKNLIWEVLVNK